jgi:hypothetical protein
MAIFHTAFIPGEAIQAHNRNSTNVSLFLLPLGNEECWYPSLSGLTVAVYILYPVGDISWQKPVVQVSTSIAHKMH